MLFDREHSRPRAGRIGRAGGVGRCDRREIWCQRRGQVARTRCALQRGQRNARRLCHRRSPPPGRNRPGARPPRGHLRAPPGADDARHPCYVLLRPERLARRAAGGLSRVLRRAALHEGRRQDADDEARDSLEPLPGQRIGARQKSSGHGRPRQPDERRFRAGRRVLQHRVRLRSDDSACWSGAVAVTYARGFRAGTAACGIKAFTTGASSIPSGQKDDLCVIKSGIAEACGRMSPDAGAAAARAIMTTDTQPKTAQAELHIAGADVRIGGMSKGSGMIHPNMATLLAYVTTDAAVEPGLMAKLVRSVADRSFNQVTIDGDSSTNDSFLILANGAAGNEPIRAGSAEAEQLRAGLVQVARDLSRAIARDGEGATKLITVKVQGAASDGDARTAARAVASSSLVKTAVHGGDPNWGRIVCALGYSGAELALDTLHLTVGGLVVFERGTGVDVDLSGVRRAFEQPEIEIVARLGLGDGTAEAWGCDLSEEYVRINADYTT